ncbi:MAG: PEPxxWA-CTERM sorting domain-containing protein [Pseudomonadota bacterium]|nr:PEPxxWA-CTERM sorting domain-containing protein [Pseudomonadota bacterium]
MFSIRSFMRQSATAALVLAAAAAGPVHAITIETGSYSNSGIGAEFASAFDNFVITGDTITLATPPSPVSVSLGSFSFEVGPNCWGCTLTPSFDALIDVTVDGLTQQLDLPYSWYSSGPNDYLAFSTPAALMFDFGSSIVQLDFDSIGTLSSPGNTVYGNVTATLSVTPVPEPASYALMLAGFGIVAFVARRRQR